MDEERESPDPPPRREEPTPDAPGNPPAPPAGTWEWRPIAIPVGPAAGVPPAGQSGAGGSIPPQPPGPGLPPSWAGDPGVRQVRPEAFGGAPGSGAGLSIEHWIRAGWWTLKARPWEQLAFVLGMFLLGATVSVLFGIVSGGGSGHTGELYPRFLMLPVRAGIQIFLIPLHLGATIFALELQRGRSPDFQTFLAGYARPWQVAATSILTALVTIFGLCFCIIPGIVLAVGLSFGTLLAYDRGTDPIESMRSSWALTRGHRWQLLGFFLVLCLVMLMGFMLCGVGVVPASVVASGAMAAAYRELLVRRGFSEPVRP